MTYINGNDRDSANSEVTLGSRALSGFVGGKCFWPLASTHDSIELLQPDPGLRKKFMERILGKLTYLDRQSGTINAKVSTVVAGLWQ